MVSGTNSYSFSDEVRERQLELNRISGIVTNNTYIQNSISEDFETVFIDCHLIRGKGHFFSIQFNFNLILI